MLPRNLRYLELIHASLRLLVWVIALGSVVLGGVLLFGGPVRVSSPAFTAIRATPGGVSIWGVASLVLGLAQIAGIYVQLGWKTTLTNAVVHLCAALLSFAFASSFFLSALHVPTASLTGIPTYLVFACAHMVISNALATKSRVERRAQNLSKDLDV